MSSPVVQSPIVVALDYADRAGALTFVDEIDPLTCRLKVGQEMYTLFGAQFVKELQARGFEVFLDLKFFDIPNTVARAVAAAAEIGVWMVNVHASGGPKMMEAAREALLPYGRDAPVFIAVTVLTSMDVGDLIELGITLTPQAYASQLATLAYNCGMDGVVCSAQEAASLRKSFGVDFKLITPGIRPKGCDNGDQRRVMTPQQAWQAGVDYMVIGRPITQSADPHKTLKNIIVSLQEA